MSQPLDPTASDADEAPGEGPRHPALESGVKIIVGLTPIVMSAVCLAFARRGDGHDMLLALALGIFYVIAFRTDFESARGSAVPTQPVLVAMLLTLPLMWVPALVLLAVALGSLDAPLRGNAAWQHALSISSSAWNVVAPVAMLFLLRTIAPGLHPEAAIVLAVGSQLVLDALPVLALGALEGELAHVRPMLTWSLAVDGLLAVVGYCIVVATGHDLPGLMLVGAPILLMRLLAQDREQAFEEAQTLRSAYTEVNEEARRDPMTGLLNRRGWEDALEEAAHQLGRGDGDLMATVLAADLDRLKFANDTYGHQAGDDLICAFGDLLQQRMPPGAAVARLGGDEYAVLVTHRRGEGAPDLTTTIREALVLAPDAGPVRLSASLGQASFPPAVNLQAAVDAADHAARIDKDMRRMTREDSARTGAA